MTKKNYALLFLIGVVGWATCGKTIPKNESGIRVIGESKNKVFRDETGKNLISRCQGSVAANIDLTKVSLKAEAFKTGVDCIAADFDENGYIDFMFFGGEEKDKNQSGLIVFFEGQTAKRSQVIGSVSFLEPFFSADPERKYYPKYKGVYGLIYHFGGEYGAVYFYDRKSGLFQKVPYFIYWKPEYD